MLVSLGLNCVVLRLYNGQIGGHNNHEVENVERITQVGSLVEDKTLRDDFDDHLKCVRGQKEVLNDLHHGIDLCRLHIFRGKLNAIKHNDGYRRHFESLMRRNLNSEYVDVDCSLHKCLAQVKKGPSVFVVLESL